jgi:regulator of RNase E activity RraA
MPAQGAWQWPAQSLARPCGGARLVLTCRQNRQREEAPDMDIAKIKRPSKDLVERVRLVGAATASATLAHMGLRNCFIQGPVSRQKGRVVAGPAVTLLMMPKREDLFGEGEYANVELQLHRHVLYQVEAGDMVVVDARGDLSSGIFGDMMMTYFKGKKGAGVVIDGCLRDWTKVEELGIPAWLCGVTPNYHAQTNLMPFGVNVPVACGGVTVIPGDIIVADDDGAVCVPVALAEEMVAKAHKDHGWEEFSRQKLLAGESLQRYYPLHKDAYPEYEAWLAAQGKG